MLHVAEGAAEEGYLVVATDDGHLLVEVAAGDDICRACKALKGMHSLAYDKDAHHHHQEDTHCHHYDEPHLEAVVASEDFALGTYDGDAPSHALERGVENIGVLAACDVFSRYGIHATLGARHEFANSAYLGEVALKGFGEDGLASYYR